MKPIITVSMGFVNMYRWLYSDHVRFGDHVEFSPDYNQSQIPVVVQKSDSPTIIGSDQNVPTCTVESSW